MPLSMAVIGEKKRVIKVGGKDEVRRFLQNLGFVEGAEITVVSELSGNMIINVKDTSSKEKRPREFLALARAMPHTLSRSRRPSRAMESAMRASRNPLLSMRALSGRGSTWLSLAKICSLSSGS